MGLNVPRIRATDKTVDGTGRHARILWDASASACRSEEHARCQPFPARFRSFSVRTVSGSSAPNTSGTNKLAATVG